MGIPFTDVYFIYFSDRGNSRGEKIETSRKLVRVLWNGSLSQNYKSNRFYDDDVEAEIKVRIPRKDIPIPTPRTTLIYRKIGDEETFYRVIHVMDDILSSLGMYTLGIAETERTSP